MEKCKKGWRMRMKEIEIRELKRVELKEPVMLSLIHI